MQGFDLSNIEKALHGLIVNLQERVAVLEEVIDEIAKSAEPDQIANDHENNIL